MDVQSIFQALNVEEDEAAVYLALLEHGPSPAGKIAQRLGVPRASLYGMLERLERGGLVRESQREKVKTFIAAPPDALQLLLRERREAIAALEDRAPDVLGKLARHPAAASAPKFQLFEGADGVRFVLKDMLLYRNLATSAFWPIARMLETLSPDFFETHNRERVRRNISVRALWTRDTVIDQRLHPYLGSGMAFKREIRVAPRGVTCAMGYWLYGNKVAFLSSRVEMFGCIIESAEMVATLTAQFDVLWGMSKVLVDQKP